MTGEKVGANIRALESAAAEASARLGAIDVPPALTKSQPTADVPLSTGELKALVRHLAEGVADLREAGAMRAAAVAHARLSELRLQLALLAAQENAP